MSSNFWETKKLHDFTPEEWEAVCTNCGQCCRIKLQNEDDEEIWPTDIVCRYFDTDSCRCTCYEERCRIVPECLKLTPQNLGNISWIPQNCAYRILFETGTLPPWHPLITQKPLPESCSVRGKVISELLVKEEDWEDHILEDSND